MHLPAAVRRRIFYASVAVIFSAGLMHVARTAPAPVTEQPVVDKIVPPSDVALEETTTVTAKLAPAAVTDNRKVGTVAANQGNRPKVTTYKVVSGDTVEGIAQRFGLDVSTILWANDMDQDDLLHVDEELKIPAVNGIVHTVQAGDTMWDLQASFGGDFDAIVKANPDVDPTILQPGQLILVPDGKPATRRMVASSRGGGSRPSASGQLDVWPTVGPQTDPFGWRIHPVYGTEHYHDGMDIGVGVGTPIKAASSGTVVMAEWYGGYGKAVRIDHGGGVVTQYAHLSSIEVDYGQKVNAGDIIAYSGNTGVSTGPHLHFSVLVGGTPVDPLPWLP